jgi:hypothetical protein
MGMRKGIHDLLAKDRDYVLPLNREQNHHPSAHFGRPVEKIFLTLRAEHRVDFRLHRWGMRKSMHDDFRLHRWGCAKACMTISVSIDGDAQRHT